MDKSALLYAWVAAAAIGVIILGCGVALRRTRNGGACVNLASPDNEIGAKTISISIDAVHAAGRIASAFAILFATAAIAAFLFAEISQDMAEFTAQTIGVGQSAYVTANYARAIGLATISCAFALIGNAISGLRGFSVTMR